MRTDGTDVGLDAHLPPDNDAKEIIENKPEDRDILHNIDGNNKENTSENHEEMPAHTKDPSQASQPRQVSHIHRLGHSDKFACHNCKRRGDVHEMRVHECNGKKKP